MVINCAAKTGTLIVAISATLITVFFIKTSVCFMYLSCIKTDRHSILYKNSLKIALMTNILPFVYNLALCFNLNSLDKYLTKGMILFKKLSYPLKPLNIFKQYSIALFGLIAFLSTFTLVIIAFIQKTDSNSENLVIFIPYGILIFFLNLFYMKVIRLSREDYEDKLKKEKEYSQNLLHSQKKFLRYAVHETNTPLAVIMANIELYELELGKHTFLSNIEAATKNIYGIYDDISYLATKDKIIYRKQKLILAEFVKSRIAFFSIVAKQSGLTFDFTNSCNKTPVYINETKLQRIIDNNITNAIKYTKEFNTIKILIYENKDFYIFEISSNSTIIKDPELIFHAYYREKNVKEGLGLGLNLVKTICNEENIQIELHSKENNTSFKYYFPKGEK